MPAYGSLPFAEQLAFFEDKLNLPTERWDDLLGAAHDRAFVVAGAMKADLLADLHAAVLKGIEQGTTLEEFRRDFDALVGKHGWTGWTGQGSAAGVAWRTRVIYETNLRTSYAAGRWQQIQAVKADRPYLIYRHSDSVLNPRPEHVTWDGTILHADDPWWQTHYPPNGWGCKCRVFAVGDDALADLGKTGPDPQPTDPEDTAGIDKGWDYAPGRTWWPAVDRYDYPAARDLVKDYAADGVMRRWFERLGGQLAGWRQDPRFAGLVGDDLIAGLRAAGLIPDERLPMAVIAPAVQTQLATARKVLFVSADTVLKQLVKRAGQGHAADWYEGLQDLLDAAPVVTQETDHKALYWQRDGRLWMATVKTTRARDEVYLVSLRQTNAKEVRAKVPPAHWKGLGVA